MRHLTVLGLVLASSAFFHWLALGQPASDPETPVGPKWWPSEWGADDQRGAANRLGADKVLAARDLIRTGSKLKRCSGVVPNSSMALQCSGVE